MAVGKHSFFLLGGGSERRHTSTFSLCAFPSLNRALLQTVVSDGFSNINLLYRTVHSANLLCICGAVSKWCGSNSGEASQSRPESARKMSQKFK